MSDDIFSKLKKKIDYKLKPDEVLISTMTICLDMDENCIFDCFNIGKYLKLEKNFIEQIKYCDNNTIKIRSLYNLKSKKKRKRKFENNKRIKDSFYNQVTIIIRVSSNKTINIKLFKNGSIQMTGCNDLDSTKDSIELLFNKLNSPRYLLNFNNNTITQINFISTHNNNKLTLNSIIDANIHLINCNFNIGFNINRDTLYEIISNKFNDHILQIKKNNNINLNIDTPQYYMEASFDPIRHACVNIKLAHPDKTITIFVFESGSIMILSNSCKLIRDAYNFINIFLLSNYFTIKLN